MLSSTHHRRNCFVLCLCLCVLFKYTLIYFLFLQITLTLCTCTTFFCLFCFRTYAALDYFCFVLVKCYGFFCLIAILLKLYLNHIDFSVFFFPYYEVTFFSFEQNFFFSLTQLLVLPFVIPGCSGLRRGPPGQTRPLACRRWRQCPGSNCLS